MFSKNDIKKTDCTKVHFLKLSSKHFALFKVFTFKNFFLGNLKNKNNFTFQLVGYLAIITVRYPASQIWYPAGYRYRIKCLKGKVSDQSDIRCMPKYKRYR
jgi:hypothetical protein